MDHSRRVAVVLAGGSGERFWPLSRTSRPKQLLKLGDDQETLLEQAVRRVEPLFGRERVFVATSLLLEPQLAGADLLPPGHILAEPAKRNTLGAVAWATAHLSARWPDEPLTLAFVTADHRIGEVERFRENLDAALALAERTHGLVTIGIPPTRPDTGFGYIEADWERPVPDSPAHAARRFREKPSLADAERFVASGNFLWNSGMFFWTLRAFQQHVSHLLPDVWLGIQEMASAIRSGDETRAQAIFQELPNISIDFALMERAEEVYVVRADFPWDDVGSWDSLDRVLPMDRERNVTRGRVAALDTTGSILLNESPEVELGVLGLHDVVIVVTEDAVLVCSKDRAQEVRRLVEELRTRGSRAV